MKNIALGQYYPAKSPIHRLDPCFKVVLTIIYIVAAFISKNILSFALLLLSAILLAALSRIPAKIILKGLKPLLFILVFTSLLQIFFYGQGGTHLFHIDGDFFLLRPIRAITLEGCLNALFLVARITSLIVGTSIFLTYTTTPTELTNAIEDLLLPLKKIKIPVNDLPMMMTLALTSIPVLIEETDKIMTAQKARGADFSNGSIKQRVKALIPIIIPLFLSSFRRAEHLAEAMECRCYNGGKGKTRMKQRKIKPRDFAAVGLVLFLIAGLITLNIIGFGYSMGN